MYHPPCRLAFRRNPRKPDGAAALEVFAPGRFDVALIDLGIPTVAGDKVAADMRLLDPALVAVLVTGCVMEEDDPRLATFDLLPSEAGAWTSPGQDRRRGDRVTRFAVVIGMLAAPTR